MIDLGGGGGGESNGIMTTEHIENPAECNLHSW